MTLQTIVMKNYFFRDRVAANRRMRSSGRIYIHKQGHRDVGLMYLGNYLCFKNVIDLLLVWHRGNDCSIQFPRFINFCVIYLSAPVVCASENWNCIMTLQCFFIDVTRSCTQSFFFVLYNLKITWRLVKIGS